MMHCIRHAVLSILSCVLLLCATVPAHGMALRLAQKGAIQDVVTEHFNSDMSSEEAADRLARSIKDTML